MVVSSAMLRVIFQVRSLLNASSSEVFDGMVPLTQSNRKQYRALTGSRESVRKKLNPTVRLRAREQFICRAQSLAQSKRITKTFSQHANKFILNKSDMIKCLLTGLGRVRQENI